MTSQTNRMTTADAKVELDYHAEQLATYLAQPTISEKHLASARYHNDKIRAAITALEAPSGMTEATDGIMGVLHDYISDIPDDLWEEIGQRVYETLRDTAMQAARPIDRQSEGVPASPSGCQPSASAAEEASSRSGIPNAEDRVGELIEYLDAVGDTCFVVGGRRIYTDDLRGKLEPNPGREYRCSIRDEERGAVVSWLRVVAQARDDRADPEWAIALDEAADFIERGEHLGDNEPEDCSREIGAKLAELAASVDTLPKGQDAQQGLAGTEGSAVGATSAETPIPGPPVQPSTPFKLELSDEPSPVQDDDAELLRKALDAAINRKLGAQEHGGLTEFGEGGLAALRSLEREFDFIANRLGNQSVGGEGR